MRCLEIRGTAQQAEASPRPDLPVDSAIIRITPKRIITFGIDDIDTEPHKLVPDSRDVPTTSD